MSMTKRLPLILSYTLILGIYGGCSVAKEKGLAQEKGKSADALGNVTSAKESENAPAETVIVSAAPTVIETPAPALPVPAVIPIAEPVFVDAPVFPGLTPRLFGSGGPGRKQNLCGNRKSIAKKNATTAIRKITTAATIYV